MPSVRSKKRPLRSKVCVQAGDELLDVADDTCARLELGSYPARTFDVVLWNDALHQVDDKLHALEQTRRVLRSGGRVGIAATAQEREHEFDRALLRVLTRLGMVKAARRTRAAARGVSTDEVLGWLWESGFVDIALQIRTFGDSFTDPDQIIGRYFSAVGEALFGRLDSAPCERVKRELRAELERQRTARGVRLERHVIFAVGSVGDA